MLCDLCKKNVATVHLTEMDEGKIKKIDVCESCSKEKGVNDSTGYSLAGLLLGLGAAQELEQGDGGLKCPSCGFSQSDFKKAGRLGCSECYKTFAEGLEALLKTMHKSTTHVGKVPRLLRQNLDYVEQLKAMQGRLEKAVNEEDFEQAALLRDEIKQIKDHIGSLTPP